MREIKAWFSGEQALDEMRSDDRLKCWELEVANTLQHGASILNIGCGTGREAFALHKIGFRVTGIDISEPAIEAARKFVTAQQLDIDFLLTDGESLPFRDGAFDVVIVWAQTFGLFHGKPAQQQLLAQCRRVLKPGGLLSFSAHDYEYQQAHCAAFLKDRRFYPFADSDVFYESFTMDEMRGTAQQAGFQVLFCRRGNVYTEGDGTVLHCLCAS